MESQIILRAIVLLLDVHCSPKNVLFVGHDILFVILVEEPGMLEFSIDNNTDLKNNNEYFLFSFERVKLLETTSIKIMKRK